MLPKPEKRGPKPRRRIARSAFRPKVNPLEVRADDLFRWLIYARDGYRCFVCRGQRGDPVLQCAHGFSRRYHSTRWDERNAWCLCRACHKYYTHRDLEWKDWMQVQMGVASYELVRRQALRFWRPDYGLIIAVLEARCRELGISTEDGHAEGGRDRGPEVVPEQGGDGRADLRAQGEGSASPWDGAGLGDGGRDPRLPF